MGEGCQQVGESEPVIESFSTLSALHSFNACALQSFRVIAGSCQFHDKFLMYVL